MSWAEVKKINSDLNVPLNELLKQQNELLEQQNGIVGASDSPKLVGVGSGTLNLNEEYIVCEVNGKGFLRSAVYLLASTTCSVNVKIYIDGEVVFNLTRHGGTNSVPVAAIGVTEFSRLYLMLSGSTTYVSLGFLFGSGSMTSFYQNVKFYESKEQEFSTGGARASLMAFVHGGVRFNNSFKITVTRLTDKTSTGTHDTGNGGGTCSLIYDLYEG